jgi:hypothetical protein
VFGHSATHKRRQSFTVKRLAAFIVIAAAEFFLRTLHVAFVGEESKNRKLGKSNPGIENSYQP